MCFSGNFFQSVFLGDLGTTFGFDTPKIAANSLNLARPKWNCRTHALCLMRLGEKKFRAAMLFLGRELLALSRAVSQSPIHPLWHTAANQLLRDSRSTRDGAEADFPRARTSLKGFFYKARRAARSNYGGFPEKALRGMKKESSNIPSSNSSPPLVNL